MKEDGFTENAGIILIVIAAVAVFGFIVQGPVELAHSRNLSDGMRSLSGRRLACWC